MEYPEYYYKFMPMETFKRVIENSSIRLTPPSAFNDPFDTLIPELDENSIDMEKILTDFLIEHFSLDESKAKEYIKQTEESQGKLIEDCHICTNPNPSIPPPVRPIGSLSKRLDNLKNDFLKFFTKEEIEKAKTKNDIRVICFAKDGDIPCEKNILMWSHYADSHRGVLCKFDSSKIKGPVFKVDYKDMHNDIDHINTVIKKIFISLAQTFKQSEPLKFLENLASSFTDINPFNYEKHLYQAFFWYKNKCWKSENEYRFIQYISKIQEDYPNDFIKTVDMEFLKFDLSCIKKVYFGCKADKNQNKNDMERCYDYLKNRNIDCSFHKVYQGKYNRLEIEPYKPKASSVDTAGQ